MSSVTQILIKVQATGLSFDLFTPCLAMYAARILLKAEREDVSDVPIGPSRTPRHHPPYWREYKPCTSFRGIPFRPTCEALLMISPSQCRKPCLFEEFRRNRLPPVDVVCATRKKIRDFAERFASFPSELSRCSRVTHSIGVASSRRDILLSTDSGMSFQRTKTMLPARPPPEMILPLHASSSLLSGGCTHLLFVSPA